MKLYATFALFGFACFPLFAGEKDLTLKTGPQYNPATEVTVSGTVTEVREVPKGSPNEGINLTVKIKDEVIRVYVAPAEFVKFLGVTIAKDDEVRVVGSRVKSEDADLILAREVQLGQTVLMVRDRDGSSLWQYFLKTATP